MRWDKMLWNIIQLLISIGLIIGGLSGKLVLRGTRSSPALVGFGCLWLIYDICNIVVYIKKKKNLTEILESNADIQKSEILPEPCNITLSRDSKFLGAFNRYEYFLNGTSMGKLKNGGSLSITTTYKKNVISCPDYPNDFIFEIQGNDPVLLHFKILTGKDGQNIEIVSGAVRTGLIVDENEKQPKNTAQDIAPAKISPSKNVKKTNKKNYRNVFIIVISVIWMIWIIICFFLFYDEYKYSHKLAHTLPTLLSLIICTLLVLIGCVMIIIKRRKGIIIAFVGVIINVLWGLICNVFYLGAKGSERFDTSGFIAYLVLILLPGLVLLPLMFYKKKITTTINLNKN
jgi:hypothetical protein